MKRHPAFQDLSRDHLIASTNVMQVRRIVQGDRFAQPEEEVKARFQQLASMMLLEHFHEEDDLMLPHLGAPERAAWRDRLRREHHELRAAFQALTPTSDIQSYWRAAQGLQIHIRWEEDDLFERLQEWLTEAQLEALQARAIAMREAAGMPVGQPRKRGHA